MSAVKFTRTVTGAYTVQRRADGATLGTVRKSVRSYNIAPRPITVTAWSATDASGKLVRDNCGTRTQAAELLEQAAAPEPKLTVERATAAPEITVTEHGRVWPSRDGDGFVAAPTHNCEDCPSIGSSLCTALGESLTFPTREAAAEALAEHTVWGCRFDELPQCPVCLDDGQPCDSEDHPGNVVYVRGTDLRSGDRVFITARWQTLRQVRSDGSAHFRAITDRGGQVLAQSTSVYAVDVRAAYAQALVENAAHDAAAAAAVPLDRYLATLPHQLPRAVRYGAALRCLPPVTA